jgi:adenine-specific DNA-methyltransferase
MMTKDGGAGMGRPGKKTVRLGLDLPRADWCVDPLADGDEAIGCPERAYAARVPLDHRKRYAQFFTPPRVAKLMAEWAVTPRTGTLLEPAVGTGALVRAAFARKPDLRITALDSDPVIVRAFLSENPDLARVEVVLADFLAQDFSSLYDAVLMNPPYLRHHDLAYDFDIFDLYSRRYGVAISRLANSYLLFTIKASMLLAPRGRAAIIVPTEWMNANFGIAMKSFLINKGLLRELIYFSACSDVFEDALTTASILLLEMPAS